MARPKARKPAKDFLWLVRNHIAWQLFALYAEQWHLLNPKELTELIELFGPKELIKLVGRDKIARMLIELVGLKALIEATALERLVAELSPSQRRELQRLLELNQVSRKVSRKPSTAVP